MAYYLLLYHDKNHAKAKKDQMEEKVNWENWTREISGSVVDEGNPIEKAKSITQDTTISEDGSDVSAYSIIQAKDVDEVVELSRGAPQLNEGGKADVYKICDSPV